MPTTTASWWWPARRTSRPGTTTGPPPSITRWWSTQSPATARASWPSTAARTSGATSGWPSPRRPVRRRRRASRRAWPGCSTRPLATPSMPGSSPRRVRFAAVVGRGQAALPPLRLRHRLLHPEGAGPGQRLRAGGAAAPPPGPALRHDGRPRPDHRLGPGERRRHGPTGGRGRHPARGSWELRLITCGGRLRPPAPTGTT